MAIKPTLDPETKMELLIKLAFGIPIHALMEEYELTKAKIINLRKNNYIKYNEFFDYWKIDAQVAKLGLTPKFERALSVVKKFYKNNIIIKSSDSILYQNKKCTLYDIIELADVILKKDNICCFKQLPNTIKNYY